MLNIKALTLKIKAKFCVKYCNANRIRTLLLFYALSLYKKVEIGVKSIKRENKKNTISVFLH